MRGLQLALLGLRLAALTLGQGEDGGGGLPDEGSEAEGGGGSGFVDSDGPDWADHRGCPAPPRACPPPVATAAKAYRALKGLVFPPLGYDGGARPSPAVCPEEERPCVLNISVNPFLVALGSLRSDSSSAQLGWRLRLYWQDAGLAWDERHTRDAYNDSVSDQLRYIYARASRIWTPGVAFDYTAVEVGQQHGDPLVEVSRKGDVVFDTRFTVKVMADLKIAAFPFDEQQVFTKFSLGHVDRAFLRIRLESRSLTDQYDQHVPLFESTEWTVKSVHCYEGQEAEPLDNWDLARPLKTAALAAAAGSHDYVLCKVDVRRKAGFYIVNFMAPALMIAFLGITGQFTHELRQAAGAPPNKTQIALAAVMSLGVLTIAMGSSVPRESAVTTLHLFYFFLIFLVVSASFTSAIRLPPLFAPPSEEGGIPGPDVELVESPLWQWRFQAALLGLHFLAFLAALAFFARFHN